MAKKIEVKVSVCEKCKKQLFKAVCKLAGIDQVSIDVEKGILTVIGNVDPVLVTTRARKIVKVAEIISVGPPKAPDPPKSPRKTFPPLFCECQIVDDGGVCTIL